MSQSAERTALATDRTRVDTRKRAQKNVHRAFYRPLFSSVFFLDHHFTHLRARENSREIPDKIGGQQNEWTRPECAPEEEDTCAVPLAKLLPVAENMFFRAFDAVET